jgi:secondary thiamine-phosphate synthase enzyme
VRSTEISLETGSRPAVVDLTGYLRSFLEPDDEGLLNVFVPHATCGVAIIEVGAGSDSDLLQSIDHLLPADDRWSHRHGSPGHGRDHVLPGWISPSVTVPVIAGSMTLGTWQSVVLVDPNVDNPRRRVRLSLLG